MKQMRKYVLVLVISSIVLSMKLFAAQEPELIPIWNEFDELNTATIEHAAWQNLIDSYLVTDHPSGIYRFDYAALKANAEDFKALRDYLFSLTSLDPRTYSKKEQFAYWVNLYNALTVYVVTGRYPIESIKDIKSGLIDYGPWNKELITIAGQKVTLNHIEHGILRPIWKDPRIHYAVNCASLGCPNLCPEVYTADNAERLLEKSAKEYINHPRGATIEDGELKISSIYDWFNIDFGGTNEGVFEHLKKYANQDLAMQLDGFTDFVDDYDWALNAP